MKNIIKLLILLITITSCVNSKVLNIETTLRFPVRFIITDENSSNYVYNNLYYVDSVFKKAGLSFYYAGQSTLYNKQTIESLSENDYSRYYEMSTKYDLEDTLTVYVISNKKDLCDTINNSYIDCKRVGGWSLIGSNYTNNVVVSTFDFRNPDILVHELGHYFGLYHTFETRFGRELDDSTSVVTTEYINAEDMSREVVTCLKRTDGSETGDKIKDTPADPNIAIFVDYNTCEMYYKNYKPMINNFMSSYGYCNKKNKAFTPEQLNVIKRTAITTHKHNSKK